MNKKNAIRPNRLIAERLEPRVLFSADPLGMALGALLVDDDHYNDAPTSYEPFSTLHIATPEANQIAAPVELIFIDIRSDTSRADMQALLAQDRGNAVVHVIDSQTGGIESISNIIAQHESVGSIHFLVHGDNEGLRLGKDWLDSDSVGSFENQLSGWQQSLTTDADILLYGCDLTAGENGLSLIEQFAVITGADVAASDDTTGHESRGGNWELESTTGAIETVSLGSERVQQDWSGSLELITVDHKKDEVDGDTSSITALKLDPGGDGISLREAIIAANNTPGEDSIQLSGGHYHFEQGINEDNALTGDLDIRDDIVIIGTSDGSTVLDAQENDRVLDVFGVDLTLQNLTLQDGKVAENGGAIRIFAGTTTLENVEVFRNETTGESGGGIHIQDGTLIIKDSTFYENLSDKTGGAITISANSTLEISNSTLYSNKADSDGGAIAIHGVSSATLTSNYLYGNEATDKGGALVSTTTGAIDITSTTFYDNSAMYGAGFYTDSNAAISSSTFSANIASDDGGGLHIESGTTTITHSTFTENEVIDNNNDVGDAIYAKAGASLSIGSTIIADNNSDNRPEVVGTVNSTGYNLLSDNLSTLFDHFSDINSGNANLSILATGDALPTHTPQSGSDAIDSGNARTGADANGVYANAYSDIGATEYDPTATGSKIFWADSTGWIYRSNEDGSGIQQIFQTDQPPVDIEYDQESGRIFWSESDGVFGKIRSTDINGNNLVDMPLSQYGEILMAPAGIAIDTANRYIYVASDAVWTQNSNNFTLNRIDRYTINADSSITFDENIHEGGRDTEATMHQPKDLEYATNVGGRAEVLIWADTGAPAVFIYGFAELEPQITVWDLTTDEYFEAKPLGGEAHGLAFNPVNGVGYLPDSVDVVSMNADFDASTITTINTTASTNTNGLQYDTDSSLVWWTKTNGDIGTYNANLGNSNTVISGIGSPVSIALTDLAVQDRLPAVDINTGIVAGTISEGGSQTIDATMLHAQDDISSADNITFTLSEKPATGDLLLNGVALDVGDTFTQSQIDIAPPGGPLSYAHNDEDVLEDSFSFTLSDNVNSPSTVPVIFSISVDPINESAPFAFPDEITVDEGATATTLTDPTEDPLTHPPITSVLDNDTDPDAGDTMIATLVTDVVHGNLSFNPDGTFSYTHNNDEEFTDSFTYTVTDSSTDSGPFTSPATTVTINVTPLNDNDPVGVADTYSVAEDGLLTVVLADSVLANDTDADIADNSTTMSAAVVTPPQYGVFILNTDGTFTYDHDGSENFTDTFTYTVTDTDTNTSAATTVTINITPVNENSPVGVADTYSIAEDGLLTVALADSVLANDTDGDTADNSTTMSATVVTSPLYGAFNLNPDGTFTYDHDGSENFTDTFTYTVTDTATNTSSATTVTINITPINDHNPVGVADSYSIAEDGLLTVALGDSVLANDTDGDTADISATMSATVVALPQFGDFTLNTDGTFTYDHDGSENFTDTFTYTVTDTATNTSAATTVTINITPLNDNNPVGVADSYSIAEDGILNVALADSVLANDTDADIADNSATMSATVVALPQFGDFTLNTDGTFTYDHDGSENFTDTFTYTVTDTATNTSAATTVTINITPVNENSPVGVADSYSIAEDGLLNVALAESVLANDTDADIADNSTTMSATVVTAPQHGVFNLNADGTFTYDHDGSENFTDTFTYTVTDTATNTSTATAVTINITPVNDNNPIGVADTYSIAEDGLLTVALGDSVLANDTDEDAADNSATMSATVVTAPQYGVFTLNTDGTFTYDHDGSENFTDTFTYTVTDTAANTSAATTVTIGITPVNDNNPVGVADTYNIAEDGLLTVALADSVLANDTDADIADNSTTMSATVVTPPQHGAFTLNADGTFTYDHDGSENFTDTFTYIVTDTDANTSTATTVTINITPVNDNNPIASDDFDNVDEGGTSTKLASGSYSVLGNDSDLDPGDVLTATVDERPAHGTITLNSDGTFVYEHDGSETLTDSYTYTVTDQNNQTDTATVTININPNNNKDPIAGDDAIAVAEGGTSSTLVGGFTSLLNNDTDPDSVDSLTPTITDRPSNGSVVINTDGSFVYEHNGSETLSDQFTYTVTDENNHSDTATVLISIGAINNNAPVANADAISVAEGETTSTLATGDASVLANDTDADTIDSLTASIKAGNDVQNGALILNADGTFTYAHDGSESTNDEFIYVVTDEMGQTSEVLVAISVTPVNDAPVPNPTLVNSDTDPTEALTLAVPGDSEQALPENLFIDPDNDVLELSAQLAGGDPLPSWLLFNSAQNSFSVVGTAEETTLLVEVTADDRNGGTSTTQLSLQFDIPALQAAEPEFIELTPNEITPTVEPTPELAAANPTPEPAPAESQTEMLPFTNDNVTDVIRFEHLDVASLIKPLPRITTEAELTTVDLLADLATDLTDDIIKNNNIENLSLELFSEQALDRSLASLADTFDKQKEILEEAYNQSRSVIGTSVTLTSGLSVGYLLWLIRGGTLMGSVLSSMPAWRLVDPLPVLGSLGDDFEESDESLESMIVTND